MAGVEGTDPCLLYSPYLPPPHPIPTTCLPAVCLLPYSLAAPCLHTICQGGSAGCRQEQDNRLGKSLLPFAACSSHTTHLTAACPHLPTTLCSPPCPPPPYLLLFCSRLGHSVAAAALSSTSAALAREKQQQLSVGLGQGWRNQSWSRR